MTRLMGNFYIYMHVQIDTGKIFYVGKGSGRRVVDMRYRSKFWKSVSSKHGWKAVVIRDNLTEIEAFDLEKYYIKMIGRRDLKAGSLVNMTDGGDGTAGHKLSKEAIARRSSAQKGLKRSKETIARMSASQTGRKHGAQSAEARARISAAQKGKQSRFKGKEHSQETKIRMSQSQKQRQQKLRDNRECLIAK